MPMSGLSDFFVDDVVAKHQYARPLKWKDAVIIDSNGQVRFNQLVLNELGDIDFNDVKVIVSVPDDKTIQFQFLTSAQIGSDEFKTKFKNVPVHPYVFTVKSKKIQARQPLQASRIKPIVDMIVYGKSDNPEYVHCLVFRLRNKSVEVIPDKSLVIVRTEKFDKVLNKDKRKYGG